MYFILLKSLSTIYPAEGKLFFHNIDSHSFRNYISFNRIIQVLNFIIFFINFLQVPAKADTLKNVTMFSKLEYSCDSIRGNAPTDMAEKFRDKVFKTIFDKEGIEYAFAPGQNYGMKFVPGKSINYQIPLSGGNADAVSTLRIRGYGYTNETIVTVNSDSMKSIQISKSEIKFDLKKKTCSGRTETQLDFSRAGFFATEWVLRCIATIVECNIVDGVIGD